MDRHIRSLQAGAQNLRGAGYADVEFEGTEERNGRATRMRHLA
jgi:hypothetical protein